MMKIQMIYFQYGIYVYENMNEEEYLDIRLFIEVNEKRIIESIIEIIERILCYNQCENWIAYEKPFRVFNYR